MQSKQIEAQLLKLRNSLIDALPPTLAKTRKKRIVFHIGTPKTGTTSLQNCLGRSEESLSKAGWLYPKHTDRIGITRQQYLVEELLRGVFVDTLIKIPTLLTQPVDKIFISSEGFYGQTHRFKIPFIKFLRVLKDFFDIEICCVFREKKEFITSLHRQFILSHPSPAFSLMGYKHGLNNFSLEPVVKKYLDYNANIQEYINAGHYRFTSLDYNKTDDIITLFEEAYFNCHLERGKSRENVRVNPIKLDLLLLHNRLVGERDQKTALIKFLNQNSCPKASRENLTAFFEAIQSQKIDLEFCADENEFKRYIQKLLCKITI